MAELFETPETKSNTKNAPKPHYHGHRDRLRARLKDAGANALQDYELLELILFLAIPRRDVKPLAKSLLAHFGSLPTLMNAPIKALEAQEGVTEKTAIAIKAMTAIAQRGLRHEVMSAPILSNWATLLDYCRSTMAHKTEEHFRILFMNKKNRVIADEVQHSGTIDHTPAYPREVMKRALELGATAVILVHNHPSGDHRPSDDDINMTHAIMRAGEALNIFVHDHIIVSKNGYTSFKSENLI